MSPEVLGPVLCAVSRHMTICRNWRQERTAESRRDGVVPQP